MNCGGFWPGLSLVGVKQLSGSLGLQFFDPGGIGVDGPDALVGDDDPVEAGVDVTDDVAVPGWVAEIVGGVDADGAEMAEPAGEEDARAW